ncbi:MAG: carbamoyl-phosphate synthase large subunit [Desulfobacteraceae bacterium]|nr:MAG: carbamoyl-phosphate synthase large subunit [Desulfobacteraceae bacterium]
MQIRNLLIANRGEIAIRIIRAANELGMGTVAVCSADDTASLHTRMADRVMVMEKEGVAAYLDPDGIIRAARAGECDAVHPGYGFLSEAAWFAERCAAEGLVFVGPSPEMLGLFGDKVRSRDLARRCGIPLLPGTEKAVTLQEAMDFFKKLGPDGAIMIKSLFGGGGRGMRPVYHLAELEEAYHRCRSEALAAFGNGDLFVEKLIRRPRHVEIQIVGDGKEVIHLGDRDCTLQRRHQKLMEVAPASFLSPSLRERLEEASLAMAREAGYRSLCTVEFLVDPEFGEEDSWFFMEVNPRLQVEHTITEELTGVDLVKAQLEIACGKSLADLGLMDRDLYQKGYALQVRINMETMDGNGNTAPSGGTLSAYEIPSGKDVRVDGCGYSGYTVNPAFDSLLAKLIVYSESPRYEDVVKKAYRALSEFRMEGMETNIPFLQNLLCRPEVIRNDFHTRFIEEHAVELAQPSFCHPGFCEPSVSSVPPVADDIPDGPAGLFPVRSVMQGKVVEIFVRHGDAVTAGQKLAVIGAMKMEHVICAEKSGYIHRILIGVNDTITKGSLLFFMEEAEFGKSLESSSEPVDLDAVRPDLVELRERLAYTLDRNRPDVVERRRIKNQRTVRENVEDLCDPGSFIEYGALVVAAQRRRRSMDDLMRKTPADGLITGVGTINREFFGDEKARCMVMAYDFTVLAGTQGLMNHKKMDRMLVLANEWKLPVVLFAEGGGGRPSDTDIDIVAGLDLTTFKRFAALSGNTPLVGIVEGRCFAGNAVLLGCCDVIIATRQSNIGMGGPAMIEGGGLGVVKPDDIGPIDVQTGNGVVDLAVADEKEAVASARQYLSYFQGRRDNWEAADQRHLRRLIPENRLRVYDVRKVIRTLADTGSFLELRSGFGRGIITGLVRIEGHPFGLMANDNAHTSGAIQADDSDKAARFMQLCNAHRLPIISLCDTPGFMVGPEIEKQAQVRHSCRLFVAGAKITVPCFTVVLRKGYGLGAMAMAAGGFHEAFFTASWPTGEFGGMGLEGAVRHALKKELAAIKDETEREATFQFFVNEAYARGKAINMASYMEIDAVIDPAETRQWLMRGLKSIPASRIQDRSRPFLDTW